MGCKEGHNKGRELKKKAMTHYCSKGKRRGKSNKVDNE